MRTHLRAGALAALALACTDGNATPAGGAAPRFLAAVEIVAVGPDVAVVITWRPGSTDSITFTASRPEAPDVARSGVKPFSGVDTLVLGLRPAPGVTFVWGVAVAYWWTDRGVATFGTASLGSTSYTEPPPAGVEPGFDSLPLADSTGGSAIGAGVPFGVIVVFSDAQVRAMDSIPACQQGDAGGCVVAMRGGGLLSDPNYPVRACGVFRYATNGALVAELHSVAGRDTSTGLTHNCNAELSALGYPNAAAALDAITNSIIGGLWL